MKHSHETGTACLSFYVRSFLQPCSLQGQCNRSAFHPSDVVYVSIAAREKKNSCARVVLPARVSTLLLLIENMKEKHVRGEEEKKKRAAEQHGSHSWCMMHEVAALALREARDWCHVDLVSQTKRTLCALPALKDGPQSSAGMNGGISALTVGWSHESLYLKVKIERAARTSQRLTIVLHTKSPNFT